MLKIARVLLSVFAIPGLISGCMAYHETTVKKGGPEIFSFLALPFRLTDVRLLSWPFLHATELNENILLIYEPDRLLSKFYSEAGLNPKAEHYMGWENETIAGWRLCIPLMMAGPVFGLRTIKNMM